MFLQQQLLSILRAAHCRSTHHFFAIDAIPMVQTDAGQRLVTILLRHHDRYLTGAKDPDTRFRDFQNHVIHVNDGYWGGAPRVAHQWYDRLQRYLRTNRWADAAHAAGVLSHYFTDPMQPLHTEQSDSEKVLHRPIEWSITKSYDDILERWKEDDLRVVFQLSDQVGWLGEAIMHGARFANRKYSKLLSEYDLVRGASDPPAGLNHELKASLSELFGLAITGWARVLERAAMDAESTRDQPLPVLSTALPMVLATIQVPPRLWLRRIEDREEQHQIAELLDEYATTGALHQHVPAEVDIVHRVVRVYHGEREWIQQRESKDRATPKGNVLNDSPAVPDEAPATIPFAPRAKTDGITVQPTRRAFSNTGTLAAADPLVDAPSIGPKTAKRFAAIGIDTVGQFLVGVPDEMATQLSTYWITPATLSHWQSQASLMCEMPRMRCRDAQLLVGAGYSTAAAIAVCEPKSLYRQVCDFAATSSGRRYLRGASCPGPAEISEWIASASEVGSSTRHAA
ncbi:MAG: DUF4332 domain-containing protein [Rubripirellula sp.]